MPPAILRPRPALSRASPTEVWVGEPVKFSTAGSSFNPKDPLSYSWKTTGGKLSSSNAAATSIDTTGLAAGTYTVTASVQDPKRSTSLGHVFGSVCGQDAPHTSSPTLACMATPSEVASGQPSSIKLTVTNPDARPLTYEWAATSGQLSPTGASAVLTPSNNDAGTTITVTGKVTDDRGLTASCSSSVRVHTLPPPCVKSRALGPVHVRPESLLASPR